MASAESGAHLFLRWELREKPPANDLYSKFDSIKIHRSSKEACSRVSLNEKVAKNVSTKKNPIRREMHGFLSSAEKY